MEGLESGGDEWSKIEITQSGVVTYNYNAYKWSVTKESFERPLCENLKRFVIWLLAARLNQ